MLFVSQVQAEQEQHPAVKKICYLTLQDAGKTATRLLSPQIFFPSDSEQHINKAGSANKSAVKIGCYFLRFVQHCHSTWHATANETIIKDSRVKIAEVNGQLIEVTKI